MSSIKILGPEKSYCDLLDEAIEAKLKQEQEDKKSGKYKGAFPLRPSAAGKCSRALAYDLMSWRGFADYPYETFKPSVYRLLQLGTSVEWSALRNFKEVKSIRQAYGQQTVTLFRLPEYKDQPSILIEGSVDSVFINDKSKGVVDVKSVGNGWSAAYSNRWDEMLAKYAGMSSLHQFGESAFYADDVIAFLQELGDDRLSENIIQINGYCMSQFMLDRGIDHGAVYRYSKVDSKHMEIRFRPSEQLFRYVEDKFKRINEAVIDKEPERIEKDYLLGAMQCSFCPYKTMCWPEADAKKSYFKTLPPKKWPKRTSEMGETGDTLEMLVKQLDVVSEAAADLKPLEKDILKIMVDAKQYRIELSDGRVYEAKFLKTPQPHYELRRSKK